MKRSARTRGVRLGVTLVMATAALWWSAGEMSTTDRSQAAGDATAARIEPDVIAAFQDSAAVRVIVSLRADAAPSTRPASARAAIANAATRVLDAVKPTDLEVDRRYEATPAFAARVTTRGAQTLAAQPDVLSVALDRAVHADLAEAVPLIRADDVHADLGVTGAGVVVAVMDTGIDTDHPMLADSIVHQECYLVLSVCPDAPNLAEDGDGHGTHVSGIITSNGPPEGVAPGAPIEAFKILDDNGSGQLSDILQAVDQIIAHHPEVDLINMSLGDGGAYAPGSCEDAIPAATAALEATRAMGITTFAAAGNNGSKSGLGYPACLNDVVAVGAVFDAVLGAYGCSVTSAPDQVTCFSQSDAALDLLAPGAMIQSTIIGGGLANLSGTSMASPMAVGVAALLLESEPALAPTDLEVRLKETGKPVVDPYNEIVTCRVDAYEAVVNDGGAICPPPAAVGGKAMVPDTAKLTASQRSRAGARFWGEAATAALAIVGVAVAGSLWHRAIARR